LCIFDLKFKKLNLHKKCLFIIYAMSRIRTRYLGVPLLNFLVAALLGLFMRYVYVGTINIPFKYSYLIHAHSHIAILGWVYLSLYSLFISGFLPTWYRKYKRLFWITQISIVGMLFSFPFQGYAAGSITFSSLHVIASYLFIFNFWRDTKEQRSPASKMIHASLLYMFISTVGLWFMAPIMALKIKGGWDQVAIQFFLHFQFNGWFVFAVLGLLFKKLNIKASKNFKKFFLYLSLSLPLTFALPVSWYFKSPIWWWSNAIGILLQLFAVWHLIQVLKPSFTAYWQRANRLKQSLILFIAISFFLKIILQSSSLLPSLAKSLVLHTNFVIGFIHLIMLGLISGFLFLFLLDYSNFYGRRLLLKIGIYLFIFGVMITEMLLFIQGLIIYLNSGVFPNFYLLLFLASVFLVLGILILGIQLYFTKKKSSK